LILEHPFDLSGKTALVTGAGRNIGRAIALEFAGLGANVVINARSNAAEADCVRAEIEARGAKAVVVLGDMLEKATVEKLKRAAEAAFGRVDIYVSNAARRLNKDFFETTDEDWHRHINMQLSASWYLAKAFVPGMRDAGWGRIIHVNGPDGWKGGPRRIPHSTAKGGLRTLTKSLAASLGPYGITANDIVPVHVSTVRDLTSHPQYGRPGYVESRIKEVPIGRMTTPEELAWAAAFLCAKRSAAINGIALHVDGGTYMYG
jgi:NAD(P)-dependent dehydrogenase (short-subunit alcohol dehydrogenase family)